MDGFWNYMGEPSDSPNRKIGRTTILGLCFWLLAGLLVMLVLGR